MIRAVLSNRQRPDLLPVSIVFPIASYSETYQKLEAIGVGHIASRDCFVKKLDGDYPVLKRLQETEVNVDELDYLAKRLESFDRYELAQFQGTAVSQEFFNMTDFINLTFCCQGVTVVQDFTDLEDIGRKHCLNLHGGLTTVELQSLNFQEIVLSLLLNEDGIITPYGVVYDNGMELELIYDGLYFPEYRYSGNTLLTVAVTDRSLPADTEDIAWLYLPAEDCQIERTLLRVGIQRNDMCLRYVDSELPDLLTGLLEAEESLYEINKLCIGYQELDQGLREKLAAVLQIVRPINLSQAQKLLDQLDLFNFVPGISSPEEYGRQMIRESGRFQYDDDLDGFYDFKKYGEQRIADEYGQFTPNGYISYHGGVSIDELLSDDQQMGGMKMG